MSDADEKDATERGTMVFEEPDAALVELDERKREPAEVAVAVSGPNDEAAPPQGSPSTDGDKKVDTRKGTITSPRAHYMMTRLYSQPGKSVTAIIKLSSGVSSKEKEEVANVFARFLSWQIFLSDADATGGDAPVSDDDSAQNEPKQAPIDNDNQHDDKLKENPAHERHMAIVDKLKEKAALPRDQVHAVLNIAAPERKFTLDALDYAVASLTDELLDETSENDSNPESNQLNIDQLNSDPDTRMFTPKLRSVSNYRLTLGNTLMLLERRTTGHFAVPTPGSFFRYLMIMLLLPLSIFLKPLKETESVQVVLNELARLFHLPLVLRRYVVAPLHSKNVTWKNVSAIFLFWLVLTALIVATWWMSFAISLLPFIRSGNRETTEISGVEAYWSFIFYGIFCFLIANRLGNSGNRLRQNATNNPFVECEHTTEKIELNQKLMGDSYEDLKGLRQHIHECVVQPALSKPAEVDKPPFDAALTTADLAALLFHEPVYERKRINTKAKQSGSGWTKNLGDVALAVCFAVPPVLIGPGYRLVTGGLVFGFDSPVRVTLYILTQFMAFLALTLLMVWMLDAYRTLKRQRLLTNNLCIVLNKLEAQDAFGRHGIFLGLEHPCNAIAWSTVREFVQTLYTDAMGFANSVLAFVLIVLLILFGTIIAINATDWSSSVASAKQTQYVTATLATYALVCLGSYMAYPTLYIAFEINEAYESMRGKIKRQMWLAVKRSRMLDTATSKTEELDKEKREETEKRNEQKWKFAESTEELVSRIDGVLESENPGFSLLGIRVNKAFVNSVLTLIVGQFAGVVNIIIDVFKEKEN